MKSILNLFEATKNETRYKLINFPKDHTQQHKDDLEEVIRCYNSPSLSKNFLKLSDKSSKKVFKKFLKKNNIDFNWSKIKPACKRTGVVIGFEKDKYKRKRPKHHLINIDEDYEDIKDMSSYSFPSGHTAEAYFIAEILSDYFPKHRRYFENIARLIGQSRIENGVHYPTDVLAGRMLGEKLAKEHLRKKEKENKKEQKPKNRKDFIKKLHKNAEALYKGLSKSDQLAQYCEDLTAYIEQSNDIEDINSDDVFDASKNFLLGYPIKECSNDPYTFSHFAILEEVNSIDNLTDSDSLLQIHSALDQEVLDKGNIGQFRTHKNPEYADPLKIIDYIRYLDKIQNPFAKHIIFEWIHPFPDGNGRIGRAILAKDLNYNFQKVCAFCNENYIKNIKDFKAHYGTIENAIKYTT